ncbi:hypothetical protein B0H13DRAFT_2362852 [Mycena leptocephala]|nr:hypothetical protein B0H13DRAFT_2366046 [Mycena leptocephala]KAJ7846671.1 hypothetical protein B0H13DRAFT_2362852 [Mycena leptocephala]
MFNVKVLILLAISLAHLCHGLPVAEPAKHVVVKPGFAEDGVGWFVAIPSLMDADDK